MTITRVTFWNTKSNDIWVVKCISSEILGKKIWSLFLESMTRSFNLFFRFYRNSLYSCIFLCPNLIFQSGCKKYQKYDFSQLFLWQQPKVNVTGWWLFMFSPNGNLVEVFFQNSVACSNADIMCIMRDKTDRTCLSPE